MDTPVVEEIREIVEADVDDSGPRIVDLHVWRIGRQSYACAPAAVTRDPFPITVAVADGAPERRWKGDMRFMNRRHHERSLDP